MIFGWMTSIAAILIVMLIVGVIAAFIVAVVRRRGATDDPTSLVRITRVIAILWAAISVVGAIAMLLVLLLAPTVSITMPIARFWPQLPDHVVVEGPEATRVSGGFDSVTLDIDGLSTGARVTWAISQTVSWLVPGSIALLAAVACTHVLSGRAFAPVVARMASLAAMVVAGGGVLAQVIGDIAGSIASEQVFAREGGSWQEMPGIEDPFSAWIPQSTLVINFPFWPIAAGLGLAVLSVILRHGSRLQNDVKGLV